jgi:hypothetical protein
MIAAPPLQTEVRYPHRYAAADYVRPKTYQATCAPVAYATTLIPKAYTREQNGDA